MIILLFVVILFKIKNLLNIKRRKRVLKNSKFVDFNKRNLKNWMNLTKRERYDQSKRESVSYFKKRKVLLREIREEYKKISGDNSPEN